MGFLQTFPSHRFAVSAVEKRTEDCSSDMVRLRTHGSLIEATCLPCRVIYNAYLCAKYGVKIKGVDEADVELAKALVEQDKVEKKLVELPFLVESDTLEGKVEGRFRTISTADFAPGKEYNYILDADPSSFDDASVSQAFAGAKTIFVNAVMGFTPHFSEGTTKLDVTIDKNTSAFKFLGGGDTLYEVRRASTGGLGDINFRDRTTLSKSADTFLAA